MNKVVLIGCGNVGMSYAYNIVTTSNAVDELVLIDVRKERVEGEALDLRHASAYSNANIKIKAGTYADCSDATIVCICAGRSQEVGETRQDLAKKNVEVFKSIVGEINKTNFNGIYLIATNPLDVMTAVTRKLSGFKPNRVIGSGTTLDSARLRHLLGEKFGVSAKSVHAYVIGEHGDSEMIPWSNATIGLNKISSELSETERNQIREDVAKSAYEIIEKKGSTCYGIGVCLMKITNAILSDSREVMTISSYNAEHDCYFSMPTVLGRDGAIKTYFLEMTEDEHEEISKSVAFLEKVTKENLDLI
ncbi:MAG: L-lactate dehydrogenase [Clostridia bacterium]|nr:L-lactate dehydrogenase [Clostridia bacterium]